MLIWVTLLIGVTLTPVLSRNGADVQSMSETAAALLSRNGAKLALRSSAHSLFSRFHRYESGYIHGNAPFLPTTSP